MRKVYDGKKRPVDFFLPEGEKILQRLETFRTDIVFWP